MNLSIATAPYFQLPLLSIAPNGIIQSNAHARNAYGNVAQEIVCAALGLTPIPIDGSKTVCFDAQKGSTFFEIKSVHRNRKVVLYDWRMEKEEKAGLPLLYAIFVHRARGCKSYQALIEALQIGFEILLIPAATVHTAAKQEPLRKMLTLALSRNGYNRAGYKEGYRNVGLNKLRPACSAEQKSEVRLYGKQFSYNLCT